MIQTTRKLGLALVLGLWSTVALPVGADFSVPECQAHLQSMLEAARASEAPDGSTARLSRQFREERAQRIVRVQWLFNRSKELGDDVDILAKFDVLGSEEDALTVAELLNLENAFEIERSGQRLPV